MKPSHKSLLQNVLHTIQTLQKAQLERNYIASTEIFSAILVHNLSLAEHWTELWFYGPANPLGHVESVNLPNHTFPGQA